MSRKNDPKKGRRPTRTKQQGFRHTSEDLGVLINSLETIKREEPIRIRDPGFNGIDYYIGRKLLGSEVVVSEISSKFPDLEIFSTEGSLVLPLMGRHGAQCSTRGVLRDSLNILHKKTPSTRSKLKLRTHGVENNLNQNPKIARVYFNIISGFPEQKKLISGETMGVSQANSAVGIQVPKLHWSAELRIASTKNREFANEITGIVSDCMATDVIILQQAQICEAPSKNISHQ